MKTEKYNSYVSAIERCEDMAPDELGRELAREQRSLHLGKDIVRRLRAATPPDNTALSAEQASRSGTLGYVQVLQMDLAKRRKLKQTPAVRKN